MQWVAAGRECGSSLLDTEDGMNDLLLPGEMKLSAVVVMFSDFGIFVIEMPKT